MDVPVARCVGGGGGELSARLGEEQCLNVRKKTVSRAESTFGANAVGAYLCFEAAGRG